MKNVAQKEMQCAMSLEKRNVGLTFITVSALWHLVDFTHHYVSRESCSIRNSCGVCRIGGNYVLHVLLKVIFNKATLHHPTAPSSSRAEISFCLKPVTVQQIHPVSVQLRILLSVHVA